MHELQNIDKEIEELRYELSVVIPEEIRAATALGDLKENSDFSSAVFRQHYTGLRLNQLLDRRKAYLQLLQNIKNIPIDKVGVGSVIKVRNKSSNKILYFKLVPTEPSDTETDGIIEITVNSPLGKSFINKEKGDVVSVSAPSGVVIYKILNVTTVHELLDLDK